MLLQNDRCDAATLHHSATSASASPWTISAPAIRRSAICAASRSTRSRSTARSSRDLAKRATTDGIIRADLEPRLAASASTTTAEGVETDEQLEILRAEGCTQAARLSVQPADPGAANSVLADAARAAHPRGMTGGPPPANRGRGPKSMVCQTPSIAAKAAHPISPCMVGPLAISRP